jgi:hypothetical protein
VERALKAIPHNPDRRRDLVLVALHHQNGTTYGIAKHKEYDELMILLVSIGLYLVEAGFAKTGEVREPTGMV